MTSKELSIGGAWSAEVAVKAIEVAMTKGIETGTRAAIDYIEAERKKERESRYKRRLHNTRLLLDNYRILKGHTENAVYNSAIVKENAIDILDSLDTYVMSDGVYVQTIRQSQQRTLIILRHIEKMIELYRIYCEQDPRPEPMRRYNAIYDRYISPEKRTVKEIAEALGMETRAVYKDISEGIKPLSALIFGIDSLKIR